MLGYLSATILMRCEATPRHTEVGSPTRYLPGRAAGLGQDCVLRAIDILHYRSRLRAKRVAELGQRHPARMAVKQLDAKLRL